jgi:stage II sporulation protein P
MLRKKLNKIIIIALLTLNIFSVIVKANSLHNANNIPSYTKSSITLTQQIKISKPKILIYHSHTFEKYADGASVFDVAEDLAKKLETKGMIVEHISTDFGKDYKKSYSESRKMLLTKDLNEYALILDLHRDSGEKPTITTINGNKVARTMFVNAFESPNRESSLYIANFINKELSKNNTGLHINKDIYEKHRKPHNLYNADLNPNALLIELGNMHNTSDECRNTNTYLSEAIHTYISDRMNINK